MKQKGRGCFRSFYLCWVFIHIFREMQCYISKHFVAVPRPLHTPKSGIPAKHNSAHFVVSVGVVFVHDRWPVTCDTCGKVKEGGKVKL